MQCPAPSHYLKNTAVHRDAEGKSALECQTGWQKEELIVEEKESG